MPFLARYPAEIPRGVRIPTVFTNVDFAPTLLDYGGAPVPPLMQGRSLRQVLTGATPPGWREEAYNRYWMHLAHHDNPAHYGIRTREHKLIFFYGLPLDASGAVDFVTPAGGELYDLVRDPHELRNVYDDPDYAEVRRDLKERLRRLRDDLGEDDARYPALQELTERFWGEDDRDR